MNGFSKTAASLAAASLIAAVPLAAQTHRRRLDPDDAYKNNCMRCHVAMPQYPSGATQTMVMHMQVRANLTQEEADAIVEYLTGGGSGPSSRETRNGERPGTRESAADGQQVAAAGVRSSGNVPEAEPSQPAARPSPPPARSSQPSAPTSQRSAETMTFRSANGSPVGTVWRDPAAGTLTLRTKDGESSYLLDPSAASLLDRDGKLYLSWRFDEAGRAEPILSLGVNESAAVVLRSAPRAAARTPSAPVATKPSGPVEVIGANAGARTLIVRDGRGEQSTAAVDERVAPVLSVLLPGDKVELAWDGDRVTSISRRSQPGSQPQTPAMAPQPHAPATAGSTVAGSEGPATSPERKQSVKVREPAGGTPATGVAAAAPASMAAVARAITRPRVIEVIADKDNKFKVPGEGKPVIQLKPGEKVVLRITSHFGGEKARDDAVHSFAVKKLRDQGWDIRLYEGTKDYPLVAPRTTGEYEVECTVKCGPGHDDMKMKLLVQS